ncbi:squalene--hopene cyclase [Paenibacillus paeoniae]|uniref:Squalene--hopene cyclase n=1 Tax=Paenibacillus paeoniae TaxID=2292705 RepID=A0A371PP42_9BACL|nr:squalene--hopene cyclase [Paenibacillus paeoniae]REK77567.1 squalene--hopene cyclase [Paenibacillus paeoniae]
MSNLRHRVDHSIGQLVDWLIEEQKEDGSWRFCFENGIIIDAYVLILFRLLEHEDEPFMRALHDRIAACQQSDGGWRLYRDEEEGSLSASVEAYYAMLLSGYSHADDEHMQRAKAYILSRGGIGMVKSTLTKTILAATGQRDWPLSISSIPMEVLLVPSELPLSLFSFSGYARVHLVPMLVMGSRKFSLRTARTPDLSPLYAHRDALDDACLPSHIAMRTQIGIGIDRLIGSPRSLRDAATDKAEAFMLERIEDDGTLYSYATSTVFMIFALLALGYGKEHPVVRRACQGLSDMRFNTGGYTTIQNSPSEIWDTALLTYALQEAGVSSHEAVIRKAGAYLLSKQHTRRGDWSKHNPNTPPGGWGFSETNTMNPDVDDTTASLRAIRQLASDDPVYAEAWNRGLQWVTSMQNRDGGWPAFEKETNNQMLTWLAIEGAKSAAIDPSEADLTGRTLEYLGHFAPQQTNEKYMKRGIEWLIRNQQKNGSWYGRWGVCYLYGTWAALTGLVAAGLPASHHSIKNGAEWLLRMQQSDGGWGESCRSDSKSHYVSIGASTPSQTAWALDALIAISPEATPAIHRGIERLIAFLPESNWTTDYPTGSGLPGYFYIHYHSYRYIWPLVALAHYKQKFGS